MSKSSKLRSLAVLAALFLLMLVSLITAKRASEATPRTSLFEQMDFPRPDYPELSSAISTELSKTTQSYSLPGTNAPVGAVLNFALSNELLQTLDRKLFIAKELKAVIIRYPPNTSCTSITFSRTISDILRTNGVEMLERGRAIWIYPKSEAKRYRREIESSKSL